MSGLRLADYSPLAPHVSSGETVDCSTARRTSSAAWGVLAARITSTEASALLAASPAHYYHRLGALQPGQGLFLNGCPGPARYVF